MWKSAYKPAKIPTLSKIIDLEGIFSPTEK
jgi:hypothetical protein